MRILRKCMILLLFAQLVLGFTGLAPMVSADSQEGVPLNFDISMTGSVLEIGYDTYEGNYVRLKWDLPQTWSSDELATTQYSLWTSEDGVGFVRYPETIPGDQTSLRINKHGNKPLESGKIYYAYIVAEHVHIDPVTGVETTHSSIASNKILFMTKINVDVTTSGPNSITIKWDDVKHGSRRLDYDIYISESKYFGQISPLAVRQENIGDGKPVKPIVSENKLSYTRSGLRTGTVYYVMIKPIVSDSRIRFLKETDAESGATRIVARILRVSDDFWRIEWNPITNADMDPDKQISYYIKRGDLSLGDNPIEETLGQTRDNKMSIRTSSDLCYYRIVAFIETQTGDVLEIRSDRILAIESEIPAVPIVPDLKDIISGIPPFNYKNELKPMEATVAWLVPKTPDGNLDSKIVYDIWLVTDPRDFDNSKIQPVKTNYSVPVSDYISEGAGSQNIVAFKYKFTGIMPNTSYYVKIVAKKLYTRVSPEGLIEDVYYKSDPALKVITTPISESLNRPVAPSKPPFAIKIKDGKDDVGPNSATITWKNDWYEFWDTTDASNPKWVYVDDPQSIDESAQGGVYKHIVYDSNITFQFGYVKYSPDIDYQQLNDRPMQIAGIRNNTGKIDQEYTITGLEPNISYLVWMRAARSKDLVSAPSDPLLVVTAVSDVGPGEEKPTVPYFSFGQAGDTYVDLGWNANSMYEYSLKYSKTDNITSAGNAVTIKYADLKSDIYTVTGLTPNTGYFFWIKAIAISAGGKQVESDWSDSFGVKTLPFLPPNAPSGFGVKNVPESIGKNYIIYEWLAKPGMEYIIEISLAVDFKTSTMYEGIAGFEKKIEGLMPNRRYYARLYSYDTVRKMRSKDYAGVIAVNTLKSSDEYDSDVNIAEPIEDDFVEQRISNRVWQYSIAFSNTDRLIQLVKTSSAIDYKVDLSNSYRTINARVVELPGKVFSALESMRKNLIIDIGDGIITVRGGAFNKETQNLILKGLGEFSIRFEFKNIAEKQFNIKNSLSYKSKVISIEVSAVSGRDVFPIQKFEYPMMVQLPYTNLNSQTEGHVAGYIYDDINACWIKRDTGVLFDNATGNGIAFFEVDTPGKISILKQGGSKFIDVTDWETDDAIQKVTLAHEFKSINGERFRPFDNITVSEAVKLLLDVCDYRYNGDEFTVAGKAGITRRTQITQPNFECSRQDIIAMIVRVYEIKTGRTAQSAFSLAQYTDGHLVANEVLPMVRFAVENGIAVGKTQSELAPQQPVLRKDVIVMIKRMLQLAGEM